MQIRFLKIVAVLLLPFLSSAQSLDQKLAKADSLFRAKQFTQAFSLYQTVLSEKKYTPAMLLKMAYIQEGLGHIGACLYHLNLYQMASGDEQASAKMEELAEKYRVEGYQLSQQHIAKRWVLQHQSSVSLLLMAGAFFSLAIAFAQKKNQRSYIPLLVVAIALMLFTALANNFIKDSTQAIVSSNQTYILDAPSAGGTVIEVVGDGHRVDVIGSVDVWTRVVWRERQAYIKADHLKKVAL